MRVFPTKASARFDVWASIGEHRALPISTTQLARYDMYTNNRTACADDDMLIVLWPVTLRVLGPAMAANLLKVAFSEHTLFP